MVNSIRYISTKKNNKKKPKIMDSSHLQECKGGLDTTLLKKKKKHMLVRYVLRHGS